MAEGKAKPELQEDETDFLNSLITTPQKPDADDETYSIGSQGKSVALILNHYEFDDKSLNSQRNSAESDRNALVRLLEDFNFDVRYHSNLTHNDLIGTIENVAKEIHYECDSLLVIILTKGRDGFLCAKDVWYKDEEIWKTFEADRCPSLIGKPKVFLFQSDEGKDLNSAGKVHLLRAAKKKEERFRIPKSADYFIYHAAVKGDQSSRSEHEASFFVQEFCSQLDKYGSTEDFSTIMMHVSRKLSEKLRLDHMPVSTSTLTKLLFLHQKI